MEAAFAEYLNVYGLTTQHALALLAKRELEPTIENFFVAMGMPADTLQQWCRWRADNAAAAAHQRAAWATDPLNVAFGGTVMFGMSKPDSLSLRLPNAEDAATVFAGKVCRPSHNSWAKTCTHWKCS